MIYIIVGGSFGLYANNSLLTVLWYTSCVKVII